MYKKYIITGHIIEIYEYEHYVSGKGNDKGSNNKNSITNEDTKIKNYNLTLQKRRDLIRRLATMNFDNKTSKFLTLTFKDNIQDLTDSNLLFNQFIERLKYYLNNKNIKYLAVIEFQERGAIHYHCLIDIPYIPQEKLQEIWGNGFIFINKILHVDNIGAYIVKYMTKDNNDKRLRGRKGYLLSRNLKRPEKVTNANLNDFDKLEDKIYSRYNLNEKSPVYEQEYLTEKLGFCKYKQFNLKRKEDV